MSSPSLRPRARALSSPAIAGSWTPRLRFRRSRLLIYVAMAVAGGIAYYTLSTLWNLGNSGLYRSEGHSSFGWPRTDGSDPTKTPSTENIGSGTVVVSESQRTYNSDIIRAPALYRALLAISTSHRRISNRNVVFAAASLEAASALAGMACQMATTQRTNVYLLLLGRSTLNVATFRKTNGMGKDPFDTEGNGEAGDSDVCPVFVLDGRPDHAPVSTDKRMAKATLLVFNTVNSQVPLQAVFVDASAREETWVLDSARQKFRDQGLIELTPDNTESLSWITKLDAGALRAWNTPSFNIYIRGTPHSSGSLERLLKSLLNADPSAIANPRNADLSFPQLTIDLAPPITPALQNYLNGFGWPASRLTIRHRLLPYENALSRDRALVESWYPRNGDDFLLVLDPRVQVSKWYLHWLKWAVLEYKYTTIGAEDYSRLFGVSLLPPESYVNGKAPFANGQKQAQPFLYQMPSAKAAIYFPDPWKEFQAYYGARKEEELKIGRFEKSRPKARNFTIEEIDDSGGWGNDYLGEGDGWIPYFAELSKARSYAMLYLPNVNEDSLARTHREQSVKDIPTLDKKRPKKDNPTKKLSEILKEEEEVEPNLVSSAASLTELLPDNNLPAYKRLAILNHAGETKEWADVKVSGLRYRNKISTCKESKLSELDADKPYARDGMGRAPDFKIDDLYCGEESGRN